MSVSLLGESRRRETGENVRKGERAGESKLCEGYSVREE